MPRLISSRSDISDPDIEKESVKELQELKEQYYLMENDRNESTEKTQKVLRKMRYEISILEAERLELNKELNLAESESNYRLDLKNSNQLMVLADTKDGIGEDIQRQREIINILDQHIGEWMRKQGEYHQASGGLEKNLNYCAVTGKHIRVLENRLDHALKKFNHYLTDNRHLRLDIDSMRAEKEKFDVIHQKLEREYNNLRQEVSRLVEESTQAYSFREDAQNRMVLLKEKSDKDIQQHHADMKELVRIIDHDRRLREFMGLKSRERQEDSRLVAWRQKKEVLEAERKKESQEDSVERYEAAVEKIKEMTGEDNLDLDVPRFIEVEDKNFALFNYVNEMNNEIELLQDQMREIRKEIENFENQGAQLDTERRKILNELEKMQAEVCREIKANNGSIKEISKIFDQMKNAINAIFTKIKCDSTPIDEMLGSSVGVTEINMIQYLGLIEQRVNELMAIQSYNLIKEHNYFDQRFKDQRDTISKAPLSHISFLPPSIGDEYQGIDGSDAGEEELRPLTRSDLELRVMKTVKKREQDAQKDDFKYQDVPGPRDKVPKPVQKKDFKKDRV